MMLGQGSGVMVKVIAGLGVQGVHDGQIHGSSADDSDIAIFFISDPFLPGEKEREGTC